MELVEQKPYSKACTLACIAMIEGVSMQEIIDLCDYKEGSATHKHRELLADHFCREDVYCSSGYMIEGTKVNGRALEQLHKEHGTLFCHVSDSLDFSFGHSVILHDNNLYDPHFGLNPQWTWSRHISRVSIVPKRIKI